MNNFLVSLVVAIITGVGMGFVVVHFAQTRVIEHTTTVGTSATGTTFNTAKTAMIVWAPTSNSASSTSILNGDANDRIIKQAQYSCTGANFTAANSVAGVIFQAATTTGSSQGLNYNPRLALYAQVSSSTAEVYAATSTQGTENRRWNSGAYLTFVTNATSTGETCVIGVDYFGT